MVLLIFLVAIITKKYLCMRNKLEQLNMVSLTLRLELYKVQLKCVSEQKTVSTLLRTIFMSWSKTWNKTHWPWKALCP